MHSFHRFVRSACILCVCACLSIAGDVQPVQQTDSSPQTETQNQQQRSWIDTLWSLPVLHLLAPIFHPEPQPPQAAQPPAGPCAVMPLAPIEDLAAMQLEASASSGAGVEVNGMLPAAARALGVFQSKVSLVGGTMELKSAFRPASYQQHLQDVWYKWMELRNNRAPGCQALRAQVQDEFLKHHLIESQHPVTLSDHTRGLAFDATVSLPRGAKLGRRRITLDGLARLAGLLRPAIAADPVHFKYVGKSVREVAGLRPLRRRHNA